MFFFFATRYSGRKSFLLITGPDVWKNLPPHLISKFLQQKPFVCESLKVLRISGISDYQVCAFFFSCHRQRSYSDRRVLWFGDITERDTKFDIGDSTVITITRLHAIFAQDFRFRIKTSGKKRRFDLSEIIFKLKKKTNEIYIYKYKLGRENVKWWNM